MASESSSVGILRATVASGLAFGIFFVFGWLGPPLKLTVSHVFLQLFTTQPIQSIAALEEGLPWSIGFGALISCLITVLYNTIPIERR